MKRYLIVLEALLTLSFAAWSQDARQRTVDTIVADVLSQMPCENVSDFAVQMKDLADAAPESVCALGAMLAPSESRSNARIEYALDGLADYACAPGNEAVLPAVREGFVKALTNAGSDIYNVQFLASLLREISPDYVPAQKCCKCCSDPAAREAECKKLADSSKGNERCASLWLLPEEGLTDYLTAALNDADKEYRATALNVAAVRKAEGFDSKLAKVYNKLSDGAKADVMNYVAEHKISALEPQVLKTVASKSEASLPAIDAASLLGTDRCADALIAQLGDADKSAAAQKALSCFNGDIRGKVAASLKNAKGDKLAALLTLAGQRRIVAAAPKVYSCLASSDPKVSAAALAALKGVVGEGDIQKVAGLLDKASPEQVAEYKTALSQAIRKLEPASRYETVSALIADAGTPARLYDALAQCGTDAAVKDLSSLCSKGDVAAISAIRKIDNYKAASELIKLAASDESALQRYVALVRKYETKVDRMGDRFIEALGLARNTKTKESLIRSLASAPTMKTFLAAGQYLDDKELAYTAAGAVKTIVTKTTDEIDSKAYVSILTKARDIFASTGDADDSYIVNELNNRLAEVSMSRATSASSVTVPE